MRNKKTITSKNAFPDSLLTLKPQIVTEFLQKSKIQTHLKLNKRKTYKSCEEKVF